MLAHGHVSWDDAHRLLSDPGVLSSFNVAVAAPEGMEPLALLKIIRRRQQALQVLEQVHKYGAQNLLAEDDVRALLTTVVSNSDDLEPRALVDAVRRHRTVGQALSNTDTKNVTDLLWLSHVASACR